MNDSGDLRQRPLSGKAVVPADVSTVAASVPIAIAKTIAWSELPEWRKDNEYILTGYRREFGSWLGCFSSAFTYVHNETVNIHSHLLGALLFALLLVTVDSAHLTEHQSASLADKLVFAIFLSAAVFCLGASAFYHTCCVHSQKVAARCHALDYSGIVVLIVGSFFPCIYYAFYCEPHYQALYLGIITTAGLGAAYIVLNPQYGKGTHRKARTYVFIALGLSSVLPVSHAFITHGFRTLCIEMGFHWLLLSGALYIAGALLYANRIPECFAPGQFDIIFASHQIFHCAVVAAALCTHACVLTAFKHRHSRGGHCS
ncbi:HlyIII-domain-containing protein [Peniophora sp. CONT]|nr:HlyIII-domain-containing protein [Peniophora sp. CONT]